MKHLVVLLVCASLALARNLPTESPISDVVPEEPTKFESPNEVPILPETEVSCAEEIEEPQAEKVDPAQDHEAKIEPEVGIHEVSEEVIPSQEPDAKNVLEAPVTSQEIEPEVQQQELTDDRDAAAAQELDGKVVTQEENTAVEPEESDSEAPNPLSRINLGVGQSASNAYSPFGYSKSKVGAASLNIGLQNSWGGYRPIAQYGQSYGSSQRTGPYAPQTWGHAGAGPYGAYGKGGYRGGYGQTQSNAYNVQKRIPVGPGLSLLSNLDTDKEKEKAAVSDSNVPAEKIEVEDPAITAEPEPVESESEVKEPASRQLSFW